MGGGFLSRLDIDRRDVTLSFASLLLAFSVWLIYNLSLNYSTELKVSVVAQSNIPLHAREASSPVTVSARCRTTGFRLIRSRRGATGRQANVYLAPEHLHPREDGVFSISANELSAYVSEIFGVDVALESFLSPSYEFEFNTENCKMLPVEAVQVINCKSQYMTVGKISVTPDSVLVYGNPSVLDRISCVRTRKISLQNVSRPCEGTARLEAPEGLRLSETEVDWSVDVVRYVELASAVPVTVRGVPEDVEINVSPARVNAFFRCLFPVYGDKTSGIVFYVDYNDFLSSADGYCTLKTDGIPEEVVDVRTEPVVVQCVEVPR